MSYLNKLTLVRNEAIEYITSVLKERGTNYELVDPSLYEDGFEDELYDLPRGTRVDRHDYHNEHPIVCIDIDDKDVLTFKGMAGLGETEDDYDYSADELDSFTICQIADLIKSLEK
jgi:hypothetical protein